LIVLQQIRNLESTKFSFSLSGEEPALSRVEGLG
jgi:hypothetical protein